MNEFKGTVEYYRRFRPGIPPDVVDILLASTSDRQRLLDVGTGTGLVVEALSGRFRDVIAIDTNGEMLAAAENALRPTLPEGCSLTFVECSADEFTTPEGWQADLVTICRAFHWLDQAAVLRRLDDQVADAGVVSLFSDKSLWSLANPWTDAVRGVVQSFLGYERRAGSGTFKDHGRPYADILRESAFNQVENFTVPVTRSWTTASILGYLYSTSFAAPRLFGDRLGEFEHEVASELSRHSSSDHFTEENEFRIHIGRRAPR